MATKPQHTGIPEPVAKVYALIDEQLAKAGRAEKVDVSYDSLPQNWEEPVRQYILSKGWGEAEFKNSSMEGLWIRITGNPVLGQQNDAQVKQFERDIDAALTTAQFVNKVTRINISIPVTLRKAVGDLYRPDWKNVRVTGSYIELEKP